MGNVIGLLREMGSALDPGHSVCWANWATHSNLLFIYLFLMNYILNTIGFK
jgi:hypothetical protein